MVLGTDFAIISLLIILSIIPLYIYKDKLLSYLYPASDLETFLDEVKKYLQINHPKITFDFSIVKNTQNEENPKTREILIVEDLVKQFYSYEYSPQNMLIIPSSMLWANYRDNCIPIKDKLPSDWARRKEAVFKRDKSKCQRCGRNLNIKEAHVMLLKKVKEGGQYNFENLITLCHDCYKINNSEDVSQSSKYFHITESLMSKVSSK